MTGKVPTDKPVEQIVIAGGGTAGWLSACVIAARARKDGHPLSVTLVEAPDIPAIGVGEGTWPTMRATLSSIGIAEDEFLVACDAAFKQGSRFDGWRDGSAGDSYLHPFTAPPPGEMRSLLGAWGGSGPFAAAMTAQADICARDLAPRQRAMPGYAGALNYGYHLDAGKFAALLKRHAVERLGVRHISDRVEGVLARQDGTIAALRTAARGTLEGDLFIDCTGMRALLIGGHCKVGWVDRSDVLFNDRALAVQVPVGQGSPIASQTIGTAHDAGWLWDIGLPERRGIGCVYSSRHMDEGSAMDVLRDYAGRAVPGCVPETLEPRLLRFASGHRASFWQGNCIAIGLSAGFVEPLEASAIVMTELSLNALMDNFPHRLDAMHIHARRFDALFADRWDRIVAFLKLHYVLSQRTQPYWRDHRDSIPDDLADLLTIWRDQPPSRYDFPLADELFPAASWQYVLYGMGHPVPGRLPAADAAPLAEIRERARRLAAALPTNRDLLDGLRQRAAPPAGVSA